MKQSVKQRSFSRRAVLRGLGAAVALPAMESLAAGAPTAAAPPRRLAVFYFPNGMRMDSFRPTSAGADYTMTPILEPLAALREHFSVYTGLAHYNAQSLGDPGGAHGRSCAAYLTGAHPRPTEGSDLRCGVSMDQVVAARYSDVTPYPSLELGIEPSSLLGSCDIGFSCTYSNTLSWRSETQALPVTANPRDLFERLFGDGSAVGRSARAAQQQRRRSILDYVREDASRLAPRLGMADRRKMDEYLESVRAVERRIEILGRRDLAGAAGDLTLPMGIPEDFASHVELMLDLQMLALRTDMTRVSTFMLGRELSNRAYPEIAVPDSHHSLSHHGGDAAKIEKLVGISRFHMQQLAWYLERLRSTPDGDGSLLDSTVVFAGASLGEPNEHDCMDLPAIIAGGGVRGGHHVALAEETPLCDLMLSVIRSMGVTIEKFGDSRRPVANVFI